MFQKPVQNIVSMILKENYGFRKGHVAVLQNTKNWNKNNAFELIHSKVSEVYSMNTCTWTLVYSTPGPGSPVSPSPYWSKLSVHYGLIWQYNVQCSKYWWYIMNLLHTHATKNPSNVPSTSYTILQLSVLHIHILSY